MPKISATAAEKTLDHIIDHLENTMNDVAYHSSTPVFVCGVNRKVNVGNFETIDVYAGVTLPLNCAPDDVEQIKDMMHDAAELAFGIASQETGQRYAMIKETQKNGRPT